MFAVCVQTEEKSVSFWSVNVSSFCSVGADADHLCDHWPSVPAQWGEEKTVWKRFMSETTPTQPTAFLVIFHITVWTVTQTHTCQVLFKCNSNFNQIFRNFAGENADSCERQSPLPLTVQKRSPNIPENDVFHRWCYSAMKVCEATLSRPRPLSLMTQPQVSVTCQSWWWTHISDQQVTY